MAAVHALYDMCERPEYIESLREEARAAFLANESGWQFDSIKMLKKLDSFFKESMRFNPPDTRKLPRSHPKPFIESYSQIA